MKKQYAIFQINKKNKLKLAEGFTGSHKWLSDIRFETKEHAEKELETAYSLGDYEFVILETYK